MRDGTQTASRLAKLGISCIVGAADSVSQGILRLLGVTPAYRCVVLYYHEVTPQLRERFAQQLDDIARYAQPIRLDKVPLFEQGRRYVAVTFDDGFSNVIENALPELESRAIPSTHFIVAGLLGQPPAWATTGTKRHATDQRIMSADQLLKLSPLVAIGSHTLTHPSLVEVRETVARLELTESRSVLESLTGRTVDLFSFPYGSFNSELVRWCGDAGYVRVFTTQHVLAFSEAGDSVVGRVSVSPSDWRLEFRLKMLGAYRWLPYGIMVKQYLRGFWTRPGSTAA